MQLEKRATWRKRPEFNCATPKIAVVSLEVKQKNTKECSEKGLKQRLRPPALAKQGSCFAAPRCMGRSLVYRVYRSLKKDDSYVFTLNKLLVTKGIATRNKEATRGSWPYYQEQEATRSKGLATRRTGTRLQVLGTSRDASR